MANKIAQRENSLLSAYVDKQQKEHEALVNSWAKTIETDPIVGGSKFKANVDYANQVVNKFGGEDFKKLLNESGYGNHPELFKVFAKIGEAMKNDEFIQGASNAPKKERSLEDIFYPSMSK